MKKLGLMLIVCLVITGFVCTDVALAGRVGKR